MWVIVAMNLAFSDAPKLTVVPGPEFKTEAECIQAVKVRGGFDSQGGGLEFSVCVPKGSVRRAAGNCKMAKPVPPPLDAAYEDLRVAFPQISDPARAASVTGARRSGWLVCIDVQRLPTFEWQGSAYNADDARVRAWAAFVRKHCKRVPTWARLPSRKELLQTRWERLTIVGTMAAISAGGWALSQLLP